MVQTIPTTQRAYTLRLSGARGDDTWREALWKTHEAVNRGAKAFGEWLLTLRGGLSHDLATATLGKKPPSDRDVRDRRVLLALSWLSVEDERGAPTEFIVAKGAGAPEERKRKVRQRFEEILLGRGLSPDEAKEWATDCDDSLIAAIRDDAVWVDRSAAFDAARNRIEDTLTREEPWDIFNRFFGSQANYFAGIERPPEVFEDNDESDLESNDSKDERAKDLVQHAGKWLSNRFGGGSGANFGEMAEAYDALARAIREIPEGIPGDKAFSHLAVSLTAFQPKSDDLSGIRSLVSGPGHKSATHNLLKKLSSSGSSDQLINQISEAAAQDASNCREKLGIKGPRTWSDAILKNVENATGITYQHDGAGGARHTEYSVILDHAARRVSAGHSWIKRAESLRLRFERDKQRLDEAPADALAFLDLYCEDRTGLSGAAGRYRIRRRAIDGWTDVVRAWGKCADSQERIERARELQSDPEMKFGDIQLFEALAEDAARCVWKSNGKPDPEILKSYVFARDAEDRMQRYKVPAYRHPDPLRNPVFCDFGNSRWSIDFAAHSGTPEKLDKAKRGVERAKAALEKAQAKKVRAGDNTAADKAQKDVEKCERQLAEKKAELQWLENPRSLRLGLWTGRQLEPTQLRWRSKRLAADLCIGGERGALEGEVSRADRLGRAAGGVAAGGNPEIVGLFDLKDWNGRLQVPRSQLDAVARLLEKGKEGKAYEAINHLDWLISFSAKLQPQGPWVDYAETTGLVRPDPKYWPHSDANKKRKERGRLILSRLPGLRLISVDLGHRYGASCAVWEAVSGKAVADACGAAGLAPPSADRMYLSIPRSKDGTRRKQFYRRIAGDLLPDGKPHPAPWARLDREFTIKLQGEDKTPRKPFSNEREDVAAFEEWLGYSREKGGREPATVLDLMTHSVRLARLGLGRHGRRARIAWGLTANECLLPGGHEAAFTDAADQERFLTDLLLEWHGLAQPGSWNDPAAKQLWEEHIQPLGAEAPREEEADTSFREKKKAREKLAERLAPVAAALRKNESLRKKLSIAWEQRWSRDDGEWKRRLKWLNRWLLPRKVMVKDEKTGRRRPDVMRFKAIRGVGGLSLDRLAAIRSLYQVQKQYRMKPEPVSPRKNVPEKDDHSLDNFGKKTLDALEKMREQRVKQLASRIAEAALGIGSEDARHWEGSRRPRERIADPRFAPCHAVVIENLTHYRPDETRTRRENRQLMAWSSSKVKKYLQEQCELHGLHLREVQAAYTSRQDSRTGAPGMRCVDVPVREFLREGGFWRGRVGRAQEKKEDERTHVEQLLADLHGLWSKVPEAARWNKSVRVIQRGGEVFVPAAASSPIRKGLQADLNAAANIGLKALVDPDWPGAWWYVPCVAGSLIPVADKIKGAECAFADSKAPLLHHKESGEGNQRPAKSKGKSAKAKEIYNLWRDPGAGILAPGGWAFHKNYWQDVERRVAQNLRAFNASPIVRLSMSIFQFLRGARCIH